MINSLILVTTLFYDDKYYKEKIDADHFKSLKSWHNTNISPTPSTRPPPPLPPPKKKGIMVIVNDHRYYKDKIDADHS